MINLGAEVAWALMFQRAPTQTSGSLREALRFYRPPVSESDVSSTILETYLQIIAISTDVCDLCFGYARRSSPELLLTGSAFLGATCRTRWRDVAATLC